MKRVRWFGWICVFVLTVLSQSAAAENGASAVFFLEQELLQSAVVPEDQESNVLIIELNMADIVVEKPSAPASSPFRTLVLELNPLGELDTGDSSFGPYSPNMLVLELGALPEDIPEAELTAMLEDRSAMLLLELDHMTADALENIASATPESLILEMDRIGTDPETDSDALVLELDQLRDARTLTLSAYAPSLIGYWQLDEGSGNMARDSSGHQHDGTLYGDLFWSFDELEFGAGYIAIPDAAGLNPGNALTIAGWVYLDDAERDQTILGKLSEQGGYLLRITGGQLCPIIGNSGGATPDTNNWGDIPANTWTHLAVTWQANGDMLGYIDGVNVGRIDASAQPIQSNSAPLIFGADPLHPESAETTLEGLLADLRLYNVPLTARAIDALAMGWRSQYWDDVDIDAWEETDGTSGGASSGPGGAPGMGPADVGEFEDTPEFMISGGVLETLKVEGMDKGITQALGALQDQRFDDAASRHRFLKAVGEVLFKRYETDILNNNKAIPQEIQEALKDLKKDSKAVQKKLGEVIGGKVMDHAKVGQEFMITDAMWAKLSDGMVKDKLKRFRNIRFVNEDAFAEMVQLTLGEEEFENHKDTLLVKAGKIEFAPTDQDLTSFSDGEIQKKLKKLKGKTFNNEAELLAAVKTELGVKDQEFDKYQENLKKAGKKVFEVTDQDLSDKSILQEIRDKLKKLKNQRFDNENDFSNAVKAKLGEKEFEDRKLSEHAKVKKEFIITQEVLDKLPEGVRNKLNNLKGTLFINETDFTAAVKDAAKNAVTEDELKNILKEADKKEVRISDSTLKKMAEPKIPEDIRKKLKNLTGPFNDETAFTTAVKKSIGDKTFEQYQATLKEVRKKENGEFSIDNEKLEKMKEPKVPEDIRKKLGELKGRSFDNEAAFSKAAKAVEVDFDSPKLQGIKTQVSAAAEVSASERRTKKARLARAASKSLMKRRIRFGKGSRRRPK